MGKHLFFKTNQFKEWMKKFVALVTKEKGKVAMNEWENDCSGMLQALYCEYKKLGQFFFHTYSLTCLNKDTPVLLKVMFELVPKYENIFLKILCICTQFFYS